MGELATTEARRDDPRVFGARWLDDASRPRYRLTRSLFLRGLGLVYLSAFGSLAVQLDGLIGSRGILPAAEFLERTGRVARTGAAALLAAADRVLARCVGHGPSTLCAGVGSR